MTQRPEYRLLTDLVAEKIARNAGNPFAYCPFGWESDGQFLNKWLSNYSRISFFTRSSGVSDFTTQPVIDVYVPVTHNGIIPVNIDEQPYSWNGKINPAAAVSALWNAFGILTENEAAEFMRDNLPEVIFQYIEKSRFSRLSVRFVEGEWRVLGIED